MGAEGEEQIVEDEQVTGDEKEALENEETETKAKADEAEPKNEKADESKPTEDDSDASEDSLVNEDIDSKEGKKDKEEEKEEEKTLSEEEAKKERLDALKAHDFSFPKGVTEKDVNFSEFLDIASNSNLSVEDAQKLLDVSLAPVQKLTSGYEEIRDKWTKDLKADKEFGGSNYDATLRGARRALKEGGASDKLVYFLAKSGIGKNDELIKFLASIDKKYISEAEHKPASQSSATSGKKTFSEAMYDS